MWEREFSRGSLKRIERTKSLKYKRDWKKIECSWLIFESLQISEVLSLIFNYVFIINNHHRELDSLTIDPVPIHFLTSYIYYTSKWKYLKKLYEVRNCSGILFLDFLGIFGESMDRIYFVSYETRYLSSIRTWIKREKAT